MTAAAPYLGQDCVTPYSEFEVIRRWLWFLVQATIFRWSPRPLHGFRAWLLRVFGADISGHVVIYPTAKILRPHRLTMEAHSMVGPWVTIYNIETVRLEYGANLSQLCHLCTGTHDFAKWSMPLMAKPIVIGRNAWLGADVFVGPGVRVGELCVVGARSSVFRHLPARTICVGNPCRPIKERAEPIVSLPEEVL